MGGPVYFDTCTVLRRRPVKIRTSLRNRAVSPEPSLLTQAMEGRRWVSRIFDTCIHVEYVLYRWPAKFRTSLRNRAVSPEPSLLTKTMEGRRWVPRTIEPVDVDTCISIAFSASKGAYEHAQPRSLARTFTVHKNNGGA